MAEKEYVIKDVSNVDLFLKTQRDTRFGLAEDSYCLLENAKALRKVLEKVTQLNYNRSKKDPKNYKKYRDIDRNLNNAFSIIESQLFIQE